MVGKCKRISEQVRCFLRDNEGKEITTSRLLREFGHLTPCKKHIVTLLSQLHKEMSQLYRVDHGTYIFDRTKKHKEYEGRYQQILVLAEKHGGKLTIEQIMEECKVSKTQVYTMLDQLKRGGGYVPANIHVERVTYYHINLKETADVEG